MNNDEKILKILEGLKADIEVLHNGQNNLEAGQKSLQTDVTVMKGEVEKIPAMEKQLGQQGKLLTGVAANVGTVLEEQQAQRMDIRSLHTDMGSLHTELHAVKDELKAEIISARAEAKADIMDLKATTMRQIKDHEKRIDALEEEVGIPNPDKN
jgi:chromosome segregation ATPase